MPSINDNFANAIEVTIATNGGTYTSASLDTAGNTTETNEPTVGASADVSAWWKYTPNSSGTATFDTQLSTPTGSGTDSYMAIWTGTALTNLVNVASDDDSGGSGTSLISGLSVTGGTTYWIQVGGFGTMTMNLVLRVTGPAAGSSPNGTVNAVKATATAAAPIPTVSGTSPGVVNAVVATATSAAPVPAVTASSVVTAVRATATATAPAPAVTGSGAATVSAVKATATAAARTPEVSGETILSGGGAATATMQALPPVVTAGSTATVVAVPATSTAQAPLPAVSATASQTVVAPRAQATASMPAPVVTASSPNATVVGVVAIATTQAVAPQVEAVEPTYAFSPPTHEEPIRTREKPLVYFRLTYANSLLKVGGTWTSVRTPAPEVVAGLQEGVTFFRGGYEYVVTQAVAQDLAAAGYSANPI